MGRITVSVKDAANHSAQSTVDFSVQTGEPAGLTPPDGGRTNPYKGKLPSDENFVPIGVWFESVVDNNALLDKDAGLNTYVELTSDSNMSIVRSNGMYAIHGNNDKPVGTETVGWLIHDEADMWGGAGWSAWTGRWPGQGDICNPSTSKCGYTVAQTLKARLPQNDGRLFYANYGKGVTFWQSNSEASIFVNQFQDIVSADNYWFTDPYIHGQWEGGSLLGINRQLNTEEVRRGSNYGLTVNKVRSLVNPRGSKPVWGFVEVGGPFTQNSTLASYIKPAEVQSAVWHSFIGGARGIIYFNHSFGGPNQTQHALRDPAYASVRAAVKTTNSQIKQIAHVINGSFASFPSPVTGNVKASLRWSHKNSKYYVLSGHGGGVGSAGTTGQFTVPVQSGTATVLFENRTIPIVNGKFSDSFASYTSTHIYEIN